MTPRPHLKLPDIAAAKLPYSRNAILGLPDSGKTVTAKKMAEHMMAASIPITAFDPSGVWRFLRVPGKGRGFPVVVVGGAEPDLPMTDPRQAADIMRAVMASGVSVVFDLYDPRWSKENWKQIVEAAVNVLWYENKQFGLRHIFLEEAAEFIPQNFSSSDPHAGKLYATIEKIARMGRNAYLGMTLINQRAEGVNKAVLELCPNLLLHRQKGRNSLKNLSKWLEYIEGDIGAGIIESLPTLPTGELWAWTENRPQPEHIKIPMLDSYHPNVAEALGETETKAAARKAVNVEEFVTKLRTALPKIEAEAAANDPRTLKAELAKAKAELAKLQNAPAQTSGPVEKINTAAIETAARADGYQQGWLDGERSGFTRGVVAAHNEMKAALGQVAAVAYVARTPPKRVPTGAPGQRQSVLTHAPVPVQRAAPKPIPHANGHDTYTGPQRRVLASLGFWRSVGHEAPSRAQVAAVAGYSPSSGGFNNLLGGLNTSGAITIPMPGHVALAADYGALSPDEAREKMLSVLSTPQRKLVDAALAHGGNISRDELGAATDYSPSSGGFNNLIGSLSTLSIFTKPAPGHVAISDWAREVLS